MGGSLVGYFLIGWLKPLADQLVTARLAVMDDIPSNVGGQGTYSLVFLHCTSSWKSNNTTYLSVFSVLIPIAPNTYG